jgi:hypothetical protein
MEKYSSISRPLDMNYPSNKLIALLGVVVAVLGAASQAARGFSFLDSAGWGIQAGLTVFLSWALSRELDPDYPSSAALAAAISIPGIAIFALPTLGPLFWLLLLLRILNRSTGLQPTLLDLIGLLGLAVWISLDGSWEYLAATAAALLVDDLLSGKETSRLIFSALAALGAGLLIIFQQNALLFPADITWYPILIILAAAVLFLPVILRSRKVSSRCDQTQERIQPRRVQICQLFALLIGLISAVWQGPSALPNLYPLWAAFLGSFLFYLYLTLKTSRRDHPAS